MTYVVTQPCVGCKYTDCVVVCPMDSFREGEKMLYIDPTACIDCDACVPECPVEAIFYEENVPAEWREFIALNAEMAAAVPRNHLQTAAAGAPGGLVVTCGRQRVGATTRFRGRVGSRDPRSVKGFGFRIGLGMPHTRNEA